MRSGWADDVLHFWFDHLGPDRWFNGNSDIDAETRDRFEPLWASLRHEPALFFLTEAEEALAAVILFDQFPRNMFRGTADAFASDPLALAIADGAIEAGFDLTLTQEQRWFLYMPYMHSEAMADQDRSVELFDTLGLKSPLEFAIMHRDVIRRFGRFPHRNEVLGRESRPEEADALALGKGW